MLGIGPFIVTKRAKLIILHSYEQKQAKQSCVHESSKGYAPSLDLNLRLHKQQTLNPIGTKFSSGTACKTLGYSLEFHMLCVSDL